jgi:hypothetical protein
LPQSIRSRDPFFSPWQNYWAGRDIFPVPIVSMKQLQDIYPNYVVAAANGNWLLQKFEVDVSPAPMLPIATDSRNIGGFTPLSHGETYFFEVGSPLQWDEQYAKEGNALTNWNRENRDHTPGRAFSSSIRRKSQVTSWKHMRLVNYDL